MAFQDLTVSATYPPGGGAAAVGFVSNKSGRLLRPMQIRQTATAIANSTNDLTAVFPAAVSPLSLIYAVVIFGKSPSGVQSGSVSGAVPEVRRQGALSTSMTYRNSVAAGGTNGRTLYFAASAASLTNSNGVGVGVRYYTTLGNLGEVRLVILEITGAILAAYGGTITGVSGTSATPGNSSFAPLSNNTQLLLGVVTTDSAVASSTFTQTAMPGAPWQRAFVETDGTTHMPAVVDYINDWAYTGNQALLDADWTIPASVAWATIAESIRGYAPSLVGSAGGVTWTPKLVSTGAPPTFRNTILVGSITASATCVGQPSSRAKNIALASISDNFDAGSIGGMWTQSVASSGTQDAVGGTLNQTPAVSTIGSKAQVQVNAVDMRLKTVVVEINQAMTQLNGSRQTIGLIPSSGSFYDFGLWNGNLSFVLNGTASTNLAWPAGIRAIRIVVEAPDGKSSGQYSSVYFDYTIDGVHWIQLARDSNNLPTVFQNSSITLSTATNIGLASPGVGKWDNINIQPFPWVVYKDLIGHAEGRTQSTYRSQIASDNPVGWWRLGESAGTTAADSSPNSNTGTYAGTYTLGQPGALPGDTNLAVSLNVGRLIVPHASPINTPGPYLSMETWVKPANFSGTQNYLRKSSSGNAYFIRAVGQSFQSLFHFIDGNFVQAQGGVLGATGVWYHCVATYDGAFIKHYINGVEVYRLAETRTLSFAGTEELVIGSQSTLGGEDFIGVIDEAAIYNYTLSPQQIAAHYTAASVTQTPITRAKSLSGTAAGRTIIQAYDNTVLSTPGVVGYWRLGEPSGTVAIDAGPNHLNGTYFGTVNLGQTSPLLTSSDTAALFGASSSMQVPHNSNLSMAGSVSFEMWARPQIVTPAQAYMLLGKTGIANYFSRWETNGTLGNFTFFVHTALNMLANPSLETNTNQWGSQNCTILRTAAGGAFSGTNALQVTTQNVINSGPYHAGWLSQPVPIRVAPGGTYTSSMYARLALAGSKTFRLSIFWYDAADAFISGAAQPVVTLNTTDWSQRFSVTGTAPAGAVTATPWLYTDTAQGIFDYYTDAWQFEPNATASAYADVGTQYESRASSGQYAPDQWHHVVGTYDGLSLRIYIDGVLAGSTWRTGAPITNTNPLQLSAGTAAPFGLFDDLSLYNVALTAQQVADHYTSGASRVISSKHPITASASSVATVSVQLTTKQILTGASAGAVTVVGQPRAKRLIQAASSGITTVSGVLTRKRTIILSGTNGVATTIGTISFRGGRIQASINASSAATGAISVRRLLGVYTSAGRTIVAVTLYRVRTIGSVSSVGQATEVGQTTARRSLNYTIQMLPNTAYVSSDGIVPDAWGIFNAGGGTSTSSVVAGEWQLTKVGNADPISMYMEASVVNSGAVVLVTPLTTYTMSVDYKSAWLSDGGVGDQRSIGFVIYCYDAAYGYLTVFIDWQWPNTASYVRKSITFTTPANSARLGLNFRQSANGDSWWRRPQLELSPVAHAWETRESKWATGKATTTATITRRRSITASAAGSTTVTAFIIRKRALVSTAAGKTTTTNVLVVRRAIVATSGGKTTVRGIVLNVQAVLWDGTTFTLVGSHPLVLWDDVEFQLDGVLDVAAWKGSTKQFNRVDITP